MNIPEDFPSNLIFPDYLGGSIANLPASITNMLGAPPIHGVPLYSSYEQVDQSYDNVVFMLIDALAYLRFEKWIDEGKLPYWKKIIERGALQKLTSVAPSTTANALTTLWTGHTSVEHGIVAYEVWLKEYGVVANMILHSPISLKGTTGSLEKAGFNPEEILPVPTMGPYLLEHGIDTHVFQPAEIAHSGLSRTFMQAVDMNPFYTTSDLVVSLRDFLEKPAPGKRGIWAYWGAVDGYGHHFGPDDNRGLVEMQSLGYLIWNYLLADLKIPGNKKTLFIVTADHGQITTRKNFEYDLKNHPDLNDMLMIRPTGEGRLMFLYPKCGQSENVIRYFNQTWPGEFYIKPSQTLFEVGLFGTGTPMSDFFNRIGELTAIAINDKYLWRGLEENPLIGKHGALDPIEMFVPLITLEL
ncbi:MAG: alkaline phosphatase family protein [Anaerolineales bacterium]|nr:alkaline phosphatase family protein [Anaerolineales bacterium]